MRRVFVALVVAVAWTAVPTWAKEDCVALLEQVREQVGQDSQTLAQVRDKLDRAARLCQNGKGEEATALLRDILDTAMPMGMGN